MNACRAPGYSLIELMVAIAVLALLAGLVLAPHTRLFDALRADMLRMQLHAALNEARSTALSRRRAVIACPSEDGYQCGQDWSRGWLLRLEQPRPGDPDSAAVLTYRDLDSHPSLKAFSTHGRPQIVFRQTGRSAGSNARISICVRIEQRAEVIVSNTGRVRSLRNAQPAPC
ncbi:GspH/FimT family protein [Stenotrophomonas sp. S41]|uniref:GspH/FimT family protein n=1 Tax=Stenotrophomonas sp. S41 TaxID=2767464 RepID=UPI00190B797D|nr:GspH/FimT family protein [Stenotrophomonas sp. S41]MBK0012459.1 GspH/FimT family protein [Stenotrophomonas sp. S41]